MSDSVKAWAEADSNPGRAIRQQTGQAKEFPS